MHAHRGDGGCGTCINRASALSCASASSRPTGAFRASASALDFSQAAGDERAARLMTTSGVNSVKHLVIDARSCRSRCTAHTRAHVHGRIQGARLRRCTVRRCYRARIYSHAHTSTHTQTHTGEHPGRNALSAGRIRAGCQDAASASGPAVPENLVEQKLAEVAACPGHQDAQGPI
jgi:hypothetical protein